MNPSDTIALSNGISIPRLGLGVYQSGRGRATEDAVGWALEAGYQHVDTAAMYGSETEVGSALKRAFATGPVRREQVFVTTKLWNSDHGYDETLRAFDESFRRSDWTASTSSFSTGRCRGAAFTPGARWSASSAKDAAELSA